MRGQAASVDTRLPLRNLSLSICDVSHVPYAKKKLGSLGRNQIWLIVFSIPVRPTNQCYNQYLCPFVKW